jgi:hypothetical protein
VKGDHVHEYDGTVWGGRYGRCRHCGVIVRWNRKHKRWGGPNQLPARLLADLQRQWERRQALDGLVPSG